jgi:hypothetical protein
MSGASCQPPSMKAHEGGGASHRELEWRGDFLRGRTCAAQKPWCPFLVIFPCPRRRLPERRCVVPFPDPRAQHMYKAEIRVGAKTHPPRGSNAAELALRRRSVGQVHAMRAVESARPGVPRRLRDARGRRPQKTCIISTAACAACTSRARRRRRGVPFDSPCHLDECRPARPAEPPGASSFSCFQAAEGRYEGMRPSRWPSSRRRRRSPSTVLCRAVARSIARGPMLHASDGAVAEMDLEDALALVKFRRCHSCECSALAAAASSLSWPCSQ